MSLESSTSFAIVPSRPLADFPSFLSLSGFDPRGIARTTPRVDCFESAEDYALFKKSTVLSQSFSIPPTQNVTWQSLLEQNKELRALKEVEFTLCAQKMGSELDYMGTSTVIRDIERMSAVLVRLLSLSHPTRTTTLTYSFCSPGWT